MAGELILIVEDNEKNLKLARDLLQIKGYRTQEAETGAEGLALAGEHRPDLILLDIQLPDLTGEEVLRRLRAARSGIPTSHALSTTTSALSGSVMRAAAPLGCDRADHGRRDRIATGLRRPRDRRPVPLEPARLPP